jgi:hypothetical protein
MKPPQGTLKAKTGEEAGDESKKSRKSVKFLPRNEEKFFEPESKATEHIVRASQLPDDEKDQAGGLFASRSPEEAFIDAVQNKTCRDLIQVLEHGAASDPKVAESGLREQYGKVKDALSVVKKGLSNEPSDALRERQKDLSAKRVLLSVYINAFYAIDKALTLRHWSSFEVRLHHIELRKESSVYVEGRTNTLCGKVITKVGVLPEDLVSSV